MLSIFQNQFLADAVEGDARRGDFFAARVNFFGFAAVLIFSCLFPKRLRVQRPLVASKVQRDLAGNELMSLSE